MSDVKITAKSSKVVIDEVLTRKVAVAALSGATAVHIAKQLNVSPSLVRDIMNGDKFKEILETAGEQELAPALAKAKAQMARLVDKAVKAIERALDDGEHGDALKAASMVFKSVGLDEQEKQEQAQNITVVLPGGNEKTIIEVPNEVQD